MTRCARCGAEINSVINCDGSLLCHACCRSCACHDESISVLFCRRPAYAAQLRGKLTPGAWYVLKRGEAPAVIRSAGSVEDVNRQAQLLTGTATARRCMIDDDIQELIGDSVTCYIFVCKGLAVGVNRAAAILLRDLINKGAWV